MVYRSLAEGHLTNSKSSEPPQPKFSQTHYVYMIKIMSALRNTSESDPRSYKVT